MTGLMTFSMMLSFDLLVRDVGAVLGGDDDGIDADRSPVAVFDGHLRFAVGTDPGKDLFLAHFGQPARQSVRQHDRHRHELGGLVGGIAEHQALVARAARIHTHGDVAGLLVDGGQDRAGMEVESPGGVAIADVLDDLADDVGNFDIGFGGDFAGDKGDAGGEDGLTGHAAVLVLGDDGVQEFRLKFGRRSYPDALR